MSAPNPHRSYWSAAPLLIVLFCLKTSFAELQEWTPTGGPHGGPIRRLFQDPGQPNTVYAIGARGGIWKSRSKGRDWTSLSRRDEDTNASDLQVDPRNGHVLFKTSNGRGVFRSDGGGLNWQDITPATDYRTFTHILLHPKHPDVVHAVRGGRGEIPHGIWTSLDGGLSWTPPGRLLPVQSIAVDPNDRDILFVGTAHGSFFRTRDRGENWDEIAFPQDRSIDTLVVDPTTSTRILAGTSAGVYVTLDAGDTWSTAGMEDQSIRVVRLASGDPLQVFVATDSGVFSSRDGGQTWTSLGLDRSVVDLVVDSEDVEYILAVTERGVFRREKEQVPWTSSNEGLDSTPVESFAFDPNNPDTIYAGSRGFIAKTEDRGKTWVNSYLSQEDGTFVTDVTVVTPDPHHPLRLYVGTPQGVFRSRNGGIDWEQVNAGLTHLQVQDLKVDPVQPDLVYVAMGESSSNGWTNTSTGGVFRSEDGGKSWVPSGFDDQYSNCLAFAPSGDVYVVNAGLWRSQDQGRSWARLDELPQSLPMGGSSCSGLIIHPDRPEVLYLGGHNGFFKSLDGGTSWKSSSTGLRFLHRGRPFILSLALHPEDLETIYAGLGTGVYETRNGGWRWFPISEGIPVSRVECVGVHPRETDLIYSCPSQGGLWEYRTPPPISLNLRYSTFGPLLRGCAKIKWHFAVFSSGQWCSSRPEVLSGWIGESL